MKNIFMFVNIYPWDRILPDSPFGLYGIRPNSALLPGEKSSAKKSREEKNYFQSYLNLREKLLFYFQT